MDAKKGKQLIFNIKQKAKERELSVMCLLFPFADIDFNKCGQMMLNWRVLCVSVLFLVNLLWLCDRWAYQR